MTNQGQSEKKPISNEELGDLYRQFLLQTHGWTYLTSRFTKQVERIKTAQFVISDGDNLSRLRYKRGNIIPVLRELIDSGLERTITKYLDRQWREHEESSIKFTDFRHPVFE